MAGHELATLPAVEFQWLLQGLSSRSRFARAWADEPKHLYDRDAIAAITALARR